MRSWVVDWLVLVDVPSVPKASGDPGRLFPISGDDADARGSSRVQLRLACLDLPLQLHLEALILVLPDLLDELELRCCERRGRWCEQAG